MDRKLKNLFEFQRFEQNSELADLIAQTHERSARALSDDELDFVYAAGEIETLMADEQKAVDGKTVSE